MALLSDQIREAQVLLSRVKPECGKEGLHLNSTKTEYIVFNIGDHDALMTNYGMFLYLVEDFKYLGARMQSAEKDIKLRKALA